MKKKKSLEINFIVFVIILIAILALVFVFARNTGSKPIGNKKEEIKVEEKQSQQEEKEYKPYSNNVVILDSSKITENWEIIEKEFGSIKFYIQGPRKENEDGTFDEIRINIYIQKSEMTNEELKNQMLEKSIYSKIEYNKMQEINSIQWMEFEAENKGIKAKILTIMKDGYMYAAEITGEENYYDKYYNEAMKIIMTIQIAERIATETATTTIYNYDNIANIKEGGTQYLLKSLNIPKTLEQTEEYANIPEEYKEYQWTGIKYSDFENEMKKYMTKEMIEKQYSEFIKYKDGLLVKEYTGTQLEYMIEEIKPVFIKGNETTYEVVKTNMRTYETLKQNITLRLENEQCVVSNIQ